MQRLTHSITLGHNYVKRPSWLASFPGLLTYNAVASNARQLPSSELWLWLKAQLTCALVLLPDQWLWSLVWERDYMCACIQHQKMASYAMSSCLPVLWTTFLTRVPLKLWRRLVVGKLHAVMSINFVLKLRWVLEPFWSYRCFKSGLNKEWKNGTFTTAHFCV